MKCCTLLTLFVLTIHLSAGELHGFSLLPGAETNFKNASYGIDLEKSCKFSLSGTVNLFSLGGGFSISNQSQLSYRLSASYGLINKSMCHFSWTEYYTILYMKMGYRFTGNSNDNYLGPGLGGNIRLSSRFFINPELNYLVSLDQKQEKQQVFLGLNLKYILF
jgi:hypothetical protein